MNGAIVAAGLTLLVIITLPTRRASCRRRSLHRRTSGQVRQDPQCGFHILTPFLDRVAYRHSLKEVAVDVPPQMCITRDNISVEVEACSTCRSSTR